MTESFEPVNRKLLIILTAPSGAGKTTIAHALLKKIPELTFSISATTRSPRAGELDGKDYYFLSKEEFEQKIAAGEFIEYEMVYAGKYYGTLYSELDRIWRRGGFPIRVVDVIGAVDLKKEFGDKAVSVFIKPPSFEALKERLRERGTENNRTLEERIKKAYIEMEFTSQFDHVIVNDNLESAVQQALKLIKKFIASNE